MNASAPVSRCGPSGWRSVHPIGVRASRAEGLCLTGAARFSLLIHRMYLISVSSWCWAADRAALCAPIRPRHFAVPLVTYHRSNRHPHSSHDTQSLASAGPGQGAQCREFERRCQCTSVCTHEAGAGISAWFAAVNRACAKVPRFSRMPGPARDVHEQLREGAPPGTQAGSSHRSVHRARSWGNPASGALTGTLARACPKRKTNRMSHGDRVGVSIDTSVRQVVSTARRQTLAY
jgi:hypothetical protein